MVVEAVWWLWEGEKLYFQGLQPAHPPTFSPQASFLSGSHTPEAHSPLPLQGTTTAPPSLQVSS